MTISGSAGSSPAATDKLVFVLAFSNASAHGGDDSFGYTPDALIDTPIDDGVSGGVALVDIIMGRGVIPFAR